MALLCFAGHGRKQDDAPTLRMLVQAGNLLEHVDLARQIEVVRTGGETGGHERGRDVPVRSGAMKHGRHVVRRALDLTRVVEFEDA